VLPLWWIENGVCACPKGAACGRSSAKHPYGHLAPNGLLQASKSPELLHIWWNKAPCNIGIDTSDLFVLDVDEPDGRENLAALERQHGALPETWEQFTGGGGLQLWFRPVPGIGGSVGKIGRNLDIRAAGNYVVAPPSSHLSGRAYAWNVDRHPTMVALAEAPGWLVELARKAGSTRKEAALASEWQALLSQPCLEHTRNNTLTRLTGYLLRRHVHPYAVLELARLWNHGRCQPPLEDAEVLRTVNSICAREARRREANHE